MGQSYEVASESVHKTLVNQPDHSIRHIVVAGDNLDFVVLDKAGNHSGRLRQKRRVNLGVGLSRCLNMRPR